MTIAPVLRLSVMSFAGATGGLSRPALLRRLTQTARDADRMGYDTIWLAEHHGVGFGTVTSAMVAAGFLLGATRRIAVGTAVALVPLNPPVLVAEQAALLSTLAPGRFRLGIGRSPHSLATSTCGTSGLEAFEGSLVPLLGALHHAATSGTMPLAGRDFDVGMPPPGVDLYVASGSPDVCRQARSLGVGLLVHWDGDEGRDLGARPCHRDVRFAVAGITDSATIRSDLRASLIAWLDHTGDDRIGATERVDRLLARSPIGSAADCARWVADNVSAPGFGELALILEFNSDPDVQLGRFIELLGGIRAPS